MAGNRTHLVALRAAAPARPTLGAICNGCGLCCAAQCCPLAMVVFRRRSGPCPALSWDEGASRYRCGLLDDPVRYLRWLSPAWAGVARRMIARWIAAGRGCDSRAEIEDAG